MGWLLFSIFADFEQAEKLSSYFADFEKEKKLFYYFYFFFHYIIMKSPTSNNDINAIQETRKLLMSLEVIFFVKKQRELEKNSIKKKLSIIF